MKQLFLLLAICLFSVQLRAQKLSTREVNTPGRWVIWSEQPSQKWEDAFVTGNGRHGTMVLGDIFDERIICVHEELFIRSWDRHKVTVPVTSSLLPKVRQLIDEGQPGLASEIITGEAERQFADMDIKYNQWALLPHPAFDLRIQYLDTTIFSSKEKYRRSLDLETGVASVHRGEKAERSESVFSSRAHNINVIRLKADGKRKINVKLSLEQTPGCHGIYQGHNLDSAFLFVETDAELGWLTYRANYTNDPGGYEGLAKVVLKGGKMEKDHSYLHIKNAEEVLILVSITPLLDGKRSEEGFVRKELSGLPVNYDELLLAHSLEHRELFRRMQLDLGCSSEWKSTSTEKMLEVIGEQGLTPLFLEQMYAMGRYLLISSCGKYPPPLQGIWGGGWKPQWIGGFVWDSNLNLAISAASMGNLPECAESYCYHVESLLPGWRLNAKNYLGYRGFLVAHYNDPENGYLTHFNVRHPWMCWSGGAGWNIRPFYERAMLMGDNLFLRDHVLPLYREMAEFYEDFLVMGSDSLFHINPSISPENTPMGTNTPLTRDATMDVAIAREIFGILLEIGEILNLNGEDREKWTYYLNRLPEYRINEDGALAEWIDPIYQDRYDHRTQAHLYPVFPGSQLGKLNGDRQLVQAARIALDKRFNFDTSSAHGLIHVALHAVRLGDIEKVKTNLDRFSRRNYVYNGLVTSHEPNHKIYNLDAALSLPRLLMEMLVYTESGKMELLPAWPEEYPDGQLKGIRIYGGHTLDITWKNGQLIEAVLQAKQNGVYEIVYRNKSKQLQLQKGEIYYISENIF
ncbi:MAG: glycoside hydrolase family 95 protein [Tannerella sp.]|jgi:hypothetical protein|nr:glycoside hydrolase family 95 protein [Tannerella sp.]